MSDLNRLEIALLVKHALKNGGALDDHLSKYLTKQGIPLTLEEVTIFVDSRIVNLLAELEFLLNSSKLPGNMVPLIEETMESGTIVNSVNLAAKICALGNVNNYLDNQGQETLNKLGCRTRNVISKLTLQDINPALIETYIHRLKDSFSILRVLHNFTVSYENMLAGDKPYTEDQVENAILATGYDFSPDDKVSSVLDDGIKVVGGLQDALNNNTGTEDYAFVEGVAIANSIYNITGNEGPAFEKIKELGQKGLKFITTSFESLMKKISSKTNEELFSKLEDKADNNKKLLQKVENQRAKIKDKAKEGLLELSKKTEENNELTTISNSLNTVANGMGVIDKLLGEASKVMTGQTNGLTKMINDTRSEIKNLERAINNSSKGDEENKEVVADNKEEVTKQLEIAKASLKKLREEEVANATRIKGISKMISNITPNIFMLEEEESD